MHNIVSYIFRHHEWEGAQGLPARGWADSGESRQATRGDAGLSLADGIGETPGADPPRSAAGAAAQDVSCDAPGPDKADLRGPADERIVRGAARTPRLP